MRDERVMTPWHLVALIGEFVLWGCAAWAGWTLMDGPLRWLLAAAALVAIIAVWSVLAAPRAVRRLALASRVALIAGLGAVVALAFLQSGTVAGFVTAAASAAAVCVAQWRDARA